MSKFTTTKVKTFEFEGDTVEVRYKLLTRGQFAKLLPFFGKMDTDNPDPNDVMEMCDVANEFLIKEKVIVSFKGLTDGDGEVLNAETVFSQNYFLTLMIEIISALITDSSLSEKKQTSLEPQQPNS